MKAFGIAGVAVVLLGIGTVSAQPQLGASTRIARELAKRIPGVPVTCIAVSDVRSVKTIRNVGIVYTTNDGTFYLSRAPWLYRTGIDTLLLTKSSYTSRNSDVTRYCRGDTVLMIQRDTYFITNSVELGDLIPYPRPDKPREDGAPAVVPDAPV